jgi:hypothetical protein
MFPLSIFYLFPCFHLFHPLNAFLLPFFG